MTGRDRRWSAWTPLPSPEPCRTFSLVLWSSAHRIFARKARIHARHGGCTRPARRCEASAGSASNTAGEVPSTEKRNQTPREREVAMRNQNGVQVELVATTQGVKLALGDAGVSMRIERN